MGSRWTSPPPGRWPRCIACAWPSRCRGPW
eukprot:SM009153S24462  [mRNA]  locus=s9153:454:540:- [translate_table: standard]